MQKRPAPGRLWRVRGRTPVSGRWIWRAVLSHGPDLAVRRQGDGASGERRTIAEGAFEIARFADQAAPAPVGAALRSGGPLWRGGVVDLTQRASLAIGGDPQTAGLASGDLALVDPLQGGGWLDGAPFVPDPAAVERAVDLAMAASAIGATVAVSLGGLFDPIAGPLAGLSGGEKAAAESLLLRDIVARFGHVEPMIWLGAKDSGARARLEALDPAGRPIFDALPDAQGVTRDLGHGRESRAQEWRSQEAGRGRGLARHGRLADTSRRLASRRAPVDGLRARVGPEADPEPNPPSPSPTTETEKQPRKAERPGAAAPRPGNPGAPAPLGDGQVSWPLSWPRPAEPSAEPARGGATGAATEAPARPASRAPFPPVARPVAGPVSPGRAGRDEVAAGWRGEGSASIELDLYAIRDSARGDLAAASPIATDAPASAAHLEGSNLAARLNGAEAETVRYLRLSIVAATGETLYDATEAMQGVALFEGLPTSLEDAERCVVEALKHRDDAPLKRWSATFVDQSAGPEPTGGVVASAARAPSRSGRDAAPAAPTPEAPDDLHLARIDLVDPESDRLIAVWRDGAGALPAAGAALTLRVSVSGPSAERASRAVASFRFAERGEASYEASPYGDGAAVVCAFYDVEFDAPLTSVTLYFFDDAASERPFARLVREM